MGDLTYRFAGPDEKQPLLDTVFSARLRQIVAGDGIDRWELAIAADADGRYLGAQAISSWPGFCDLLWGENTIIAVCGVQGTPLPLDSLPDWYFGLIRWILGHRLGPGMVAGCAFAADNTDVLRLLRDIWRYELTFETPELVGYAMSYEDLARRGDLVP